LEQSILTKEELRRLFSLDCTTYSDTHDTCGCTRCPKCVEGDLGRDADPEYKTWEEQIDEADEQKLDEWAHHHRMDKVPDDIMKKSAGDEVSFVFSLKVEGCAIDDSKKNPAAGAAEKPKDAPPATKVPSTAPVVSSSRPQFSINRPTSTFVPPSRRPLTVMNTSVGKVTTNASKPAPPPPGRFGAQRKPVTKPDLKPKGRKKAIESESDDDDMCDDDTEEEDEEEDEEESEAEESESEAEEDGAVPDSEDEDIADTSDVPVKKRANASSDVSASRLKAPRVSSVSSELGIALPSKTNDDEDEEASEYSESEY
jgi:DNA repair and recombination protein RAD54 and RAD54-like protein